MSDSVTLEQFTSDPDMAEVMLETAILVGLVREDDIPGAVERIEGWDRDFTGTVALMLALAASAQGVGQ